MTLLLLVEEGLGFELELDFPIVLCVLQLPSANDTSPVTFIDSGSLALSMWFFMFLYTVCMRVLLYMKIPRVFILLPQLDF